MTTKNVSSSSRAPEAAPKERPAADKEPGEDDPRLNDLNPVVPDAVSPQVRSDGDGPVRGDMTRETGAGAAGGRDPGGPGGREPERRLREDERGGTSVDSGD